MTRPILAFVLPALALFGSDACAQWIFTPSEPLAKQAGTQLGRAAARIPSFGTDSAPEQAASASGPSSEWDQSGTIGRKDRDASWRHDERMSGIYGYLQGLRDGANAVWPHWGPLPPGPGPGPLLRQPAPSHGQPQKPKGR
jgi:hypothetical protein